MTIKNKTTLPLILVLFTFNIFIELRYNDTKFKDLLIEFDISTKSTSRLS